MWRSLTVMAYDVMDEVQVTANVRLYHDVPPTRSEVEVTRVFRVQGVGASDGDVWARDVAVALAESLGCHQHVDE